MAETRVQGTSEKLPNPNPDSPSKLPEETDSNSGSFVKFVDDSDPLRTIWKRKVLPIVYGTVLAIIAAPLLLGVMISWEVATFSCGFTTIVIGSIGFCIVFIYAYKHYLDFNELRVEGEDVTFIREPDQDVKQSHVCLIPFSEMSMIRWNRWRYDIVKVDGSIVDVPYSFNDSKSIPKLALAFHAYVKKTTGEDVPVYLTPDDVDHAAKEISPIGRSDPTDHGTGDHPIERLIGLITLFSAIFTPLFGFGFFHELLWNHSFHLRTATCFGVNALLLIITVFWYRSQFKRKEIQRSLTGTELNKSISKGFYILVARREGFDEVARKMRWDHKLGKYRQRDAGFEESLLKSVFPFLFLILFILFFFFIASIGDLLWFIIVERPSLSELQFHSIDNNSVLVIPSFIVLSSATFRISDRMSALAGKDIGRIKRLLGERYWGRTTENGELEDRGGWGGARCLNRKLPRE